MRPSPQLVPICPQEHMHDIHVGPWYIHFFTFFYNCGILGPDILGHCLLETFFEIIAHNSTEVAKISQKPI
jgi:hypothetical protein